MTSKQIELNGTTIVQLAHYPGENEPTHVLTLHAPLTLALAEFLKCKDLAFDVHDQPRKFEGKIGLTHELEDVEIKMPGFMGTSDPMRPTKVWKFRISRDTELALGLDFRAHFKGIAEQTILNDLLTQFNKEEFDFQIVSLQGELFPEQPVHDGSGTRVDMSAAESESDDEPQESDAAEEDKIPDDLCVSCENSIPLNPPPHGDFHTNGLKCKRANEAALASATQVNGRRRRIGNRPDPEAERAAQLKAGKAAKDPEAEYAGVVN